jgi:glyoxylase-like metal-dependent hydrolase (beta-lactamase superfamily II)
MVTFKHENLICERFVLGPMEVNTYLVYDKDSSDALLVDPAEQSQQLLSRIQKLDLKIKGIFLTHGHADHIYGVEFFRKKTDAPVLISQADAPMLEDANLNLSNFIGESIILDPAEKLLKDGDNITIGNYEGQFSQVEGHTPGGLILIFDGIVISGDTLFAGSIGRSDFPGGDGRQLIEDIKNKLFSLSDRQVLPGHGPETTISEEKANNPFFSAEFTV